MSRSGRCSAMRSIIWPPTMPWLPAACASAATSSQRTPGSPWVSGCGQHLEGERQQRVARQNGGGVVERLVARSAGRAEDRCCPSPAGRHAPANRHAPARSPPPTCSALRAPTREELRARQHEERPQALARRERGIAHRLEARAPRARPARAISRSRVASVSAAASASAVREVGARGPERLSQGKQAPSPAGRRRR